VSTTNARQYNFPKMGIWLDSYIFAFQVSNANSIITGPSVVAINRDDVLAGRTTNFLEYSILGTTAYPLPPDVDSWDQPPSGSPVPVMTFPVNNALRFYYLNVNWSARTISLAASYTVNVNPFTALCSYPNSCISQPGTTTRLSSQGDMFNYRMAYRKFPTYDTVVTNHVIDGGGGRGIIRWYEIRGLTGGGAPFIYQQSNFAPVDGTTRWIGTMAMDSRGNIGLGYSIASSTVYPGLALTGRFATDALNTMTVGERVIQSGSASQVSTTVYGLYYSMNVDPSDNVTFWSTGQYYYRTGVNTWDTRIYSFRLCLASCPLGTVRDPTGQTCCIPCETGTFSPSYGSSCQACPENTFNDKQGQRFCTPCPFGSFNPNRGSSATTDCQTCPQNPTLNLPEAYCYSSIEYGTQYPGVSPEAFLVHQLCLSRLARSRPIPRAI